MFSAKNTPVEHRFLWIPGRATAKVIHLLRKGLPQTLPPNTVMLFVSFSFADIPLGTTFNAAFPRNKPDEAVHCTSRIVAVTQQWGKPFDQIPHGWKTVCAVEFPAGIPPLVLALPTIESWYENDAGLCLCELDTVIALSAAELKL